MRRLLPSLAFLLLAGCAAPDRGANETVNRAQAARDRYWQVQATQLPQPPDQP